MLRKHVQSNSSETISSEARPGPKQFELAQWELWKRWHNEHDMAAREQLICGYLPYARVVAAMAYARRTQDDVEFAEYLQMASVGLVEAVERFDPDLGAQFRTFAHKRMQGAILNGLERLTEKNQQIALQTRLRRERLDIIKAQALADVAGKIALQQGGTATRDRAREGLFSYLAEVGIGLALGVLLDGTGMVDFDSIGEGASAVSPEVSYFRQAELRDLRQLVRDLLGRLSAQEQLVIRYHYLQEVSFDDIAGRLEVGRSRVSQLHRQALKTLRECLRHTDSCDRLL